MPKGDKKGPEGLGPMTGRGFGYCAGYDAPGYFNNVYGRGAGRGFGIGRGMGLGFRGGRRHMHYQYRYRQAAYNVPAKEEELYLLKAQAENLKKELEEIQNRISELDTKKNG